MEGINLHPRVSEFMFVESVYLSVKSIHSIRRVGLFVESIHFTPRTCLFVQVKSIPWLESAESSSLQIVYFTHAMQSPQQPRKREQKAFMEQKNGIRSLP